MVLPRVNVSSVSKRLACLSNWTRKSGRRHEVVNIENLVSQMSYWRGNSEIRDMRNRHFVS